LARLDQLQHLRTHTAGTTLTIKGLKNGAPGSLQLANGGGGLSHGLMVSGLLEQIVATGRRGRRLASRLHA